MTNAPSPNPKSSDSDEALLAKINAAVAKHNAAEQAVTSAQSELESKRSELVSKSKVVGELLLEAKKRHPKVEDFEAFLKRVRGLELSRAYHLLRLAGGRTTDEELRKEGRERVRNTAPRKSCQSRSRNLFPLQTPFGRPVSGAAGALRIGPAIDEILGGAEWHRDDKAKRKMGSGTRGPHAFW